MALKFSMVVEMVNRMSRPGREVRRDTRELSKSMRELGRAGSVAGRGLDRAARSGDGMRNRLGVRLFSSVKRLAGPMGLKAVEKAGYGAGRAIGATIRQVGALSVRLGQLAAASAAIGGTALLGGIINTTAKFEQFQIMLEGTEGSAAKARKTMAWVQDFAKRTPYELEQVMEAFVQLKAYGIDPMDGALRSAGDAASAMSKPLIDAVEALADAQTGEFERLKSFGIRASVAGNRVTLSYVKNNKEIRREVAKTSTALNDAVTGIWNDRFGGGMNRQAGTLFGIINNIKDQWIGFMLAVGQAGVFDKVKAKLQGVLDWLDKRMSDGSVSRWANMLSERLEDVVDSIKGVDEADINNFLGDLAAAAKACADVVRGLGKIYTFIKKIDSAWGSVDAWTDRWRLGGSGWGDMLRGGKPKPASPQARPLPQKTRDQMWRNALQPKAAPRASPIGIRGTAINPSSGRPSTQAVSGKITLDVRTDRGTTVHARNMSASGPLGIDMIYRGAANSGFG